MSCLRGSGLPWRAAKEVASPGEQQRGARLRSERQGGAPPNQPPQLLVSLAGERSRMRVSPTDSTPRAAVCCGAAHGCRVVPQPRQGR
jgi:hypothetical protein